MKRMRYGFGQPAAPALAYVLVMLAGCSSASSLGSGSGSTAAASGGASSGATAAGTTSGDGATAGVSEVGITGSATGAAGSTSSVSSGDASGSSGASATGSASGDTSQGSGASGTSATGSPGTGGTGASSGTGGGAGDASASLPTGKSTGCGTAPPAADASGKFVQHDITVTGVDPAFVAAHPAQAPGSWTNRIYFLDLPADYDPNKAYPVIFGGGGCGGEIGTNGNDGGFRVLPLSTPEAIQIGRSYVWPQGAGACFADGYSNTPDLPYFDSILAEVESTYCVDRGNLFAAGYSSGAWESYLLGFARGGTVLRGISTAAGGLRMDRPPPSGKPFAAILLTGASDTENPITGPTGSGLARDLVLQTDGCVGTATTPWTVYPDGNCQQYTGCPAAYPVIWCTGGGTGHTNGGAGYPAAIWTFWSGLPAVQ